MVRIKALILFLICISVVNANDNAKINKFLEVTGIASQLRNLPVSLMKDFNVNIAMDTTFLSEEYLVEFGRENIERIVQENKDQILKAPLDEIITWFEEPVGKKLRMKDTHWINKDDVPKDTLIPDLSEEKQQMLDNLISYIELGKFSEKMTVKISEISFKAMIFAEGINAGREQDTLMKYLSSEAYTKIINSQVKKFISSGEIKYIEYEQSFYHDYGFLSIEELDELTVFLTAPVGQKYSKIYFFLIDKCLDSIYKNIEFFK